MEKMRRSRQTPDSEDSADYTLEFVTETATDICVNTEFGKKVWLQKSKIDWKDNEDGTCTVTVPEWLATDKGLV